MFAIHTFGGCPLYNPIKVLTESAIARHPFRAIGFKGAPFALSSGAAVQLLKFGRGELTIPRDIRDLCYGDPNHVPDEQGKVLLDRVEVALVEMSTPIEVIYKGYVLNNNRVKDRLLPRIYKRLPQLQPFANKWRSIGLQGVKESVRAATAEEILKVLPATTEDELFVRDVVATTTARETKTADIAADLRFLQSQLRVPIGIIMHNFNYMPDGRPISWPGDFRDNCFAAAKQAGIPVYDPAPLVAQHGTAFAMKNDRHYSDEFLPLVADGYRQFISQLIGKPIAPAAKALRKARRVRPTPGIEHLSLGL